MNRAELERRAQLWQRHRAIRAAWLASAAGFLAASLVTRVSPVGAVIASAAVLLSVVIFLRRREDPVTAETIAAQLNRLCPSLEESAGLWLREPTALTLIERLQLRRTNAAWEALAERATLACPRTRALRPAVVLCAAAASATVLVILWPRTRETAAVSSMR
jgi:hypothetical protein